jgi:D-alanine-D-alanine ligase
MTKQRIGVMYGGRSGEHEVSLQSAQSVLAALDRSRYDVVEIGITRAGKWLVGEGVMQALTERTGRGARAAMLAEPGPARIWQIETGAGEDELRLKLFREADVIFPVLHGTFGEDGTLQGLLEMAEVPYVGAGVLASAVAMDKALFKQLMRAHGVPVVEYVLCTRGEIAHDLDGVVRRAEAAAPYPLFTKPANLGSSVGISRCANRSDLTEGLADAARYDRRVLIERGVDAREIEVSVLGNDQPEASVAGEVVPSREFYSYESKYIDGTSQLRIPADLPLETMQKVRRLAIEAYRAIDGAGLARADFLLDRKTGELYISELNTMPGFTSISMYAKLWEQSGLAYPQLIDRLIELALERHADRTQSERTFERN